MRTPQRAILKRSNARSCFEPRRSRDPAGGRFALKPTDGGRAFWRPPTGPRDATSTTRASASDPHSGQYVRVSSSRIRQRFTLAILPTLLGALLVAPASGQEAVSVSVAAGRAGYIEVFCQAGRPPLVASPEFALTRTGDLSGTLEVQLSWSGDLPTRMVVGPTSATFEPGESTTTVAATFSATPFPSGTLLVAVDAGTGYVPGNPPLASGSFVISTPSCVGFGPLVIGGVPRLTG
jgi:hypothetical protein